MKIRQNLLVKLKEASATQTQTAILTFNLPVINNFFPFFFTEILSTLSLYSGQCCTIREVTESVAVVASIAYIDTAHVTPVSDDA